MILESIIETVRACEGTLPDEIVGRIVCMFTDRSWGNFSRGNGRFGIYGGQGDDFWSHSWPQSFSPHVCTDAALRLVMDRWPELKDGTIKINTTSKRFTFSFFLGVRKKGRSDAKLYSGCSAFLPLAILEAALIALSEDALPAAPSNVGTGEGA